MNERTYNQNPDKLRYQERIERVEPENVVKLCLNDSNIKSVLDIGTGTGLFAEEFFKHNIKVTGVDINPNMIEAAKRNVPEGDFKIGTAEELPVNDKSCDLVFMGMVFHEVDNHLKALQEAKRAAVKAAAILEWPYKDEEAGPPIEHRLREEFILNLAKEAGFSKTEIYPLKRLVLYKMLV